MSTTIESRYNFGDRVRCRVSGYEGIVYGIVKWMYGCVRIAVHPPYNKDKGDVAKVMEFDEDQLELIEEKAVPVTPTPVEPQQQQQKAPGGPPTARER